MDQLPYEGFFCNLDSKLEHVNLNNDFFFFCNLDYALYLLSFFSDIAELIYEL